MTGDERRKTLESPATSGKTTEERIAEDAARRVDALLAMAQAASDVIDACVLDERGDFGTCVVVPLPVMAQLVKARKALPEGLLGERAPEAAPAPSREEDVLGKLAQLGGMNPASFGRECTCGEGGADVVRIGKHRPHKPWCAKAGA